VGGGRGDKKRDRFFHQGGFKAEEKKLSFWGVGFRVKSVGRLEKGKRRKTNSASGGGGE